MAEKAEKMPRGLTVVHQDGELLITYQHHRIAGVFLFVAGLFWFVMLVPCYRVLSRGGSFGLWELMAFLPFLGAALGFGYVGLAKMLNRTRLRITPGEISVSHAPIRWFGAVQMSTKGVKSYSVKRDLKPRDVRHRVTLGLMADREDGTHVPLLRAINDGKAARRMQEEAQAYLLEQQRTASRDPN